MLIRFSFYLYFFVKEKIIESVSFCHAPESGKFHSSARQTVFAYVWRGLNLFADRFYQDLGAAVMSHVFFWYIKMLDGTSGQE